MSRSETQMVSLSKDGLDSFPRLHLEDQQTLSYATWISEVMSQQTTLAVVVPRYLEFVRTLPNVHSLAHCTEPQLRSLWAGLGYYARARNLQKGALHIENKCQGIFPTTYEDWLLVPGCGPYTAAMVASVAANARVAAVDGNVTRLVSRLLCLGDSTWTTHGQTKILALATEHIQKAPVPGDFNQAMIELGALVCRKQNPLCTHCPVSAWCKAFQCDETEKHPPTKPRRDTVALDLKAIVFVAADTGEIGLTVRTHGFLSSTQGFPLLTLENSDNIPPSTARPFAHSITHHRLRVQGHAILLATRDEIFRNEWQQILTTAGCETDVHWMHRHQIPDALSTSLDRKIWKSVNPLT